MVLAESNSVSGLRVRFEAVFDAFNRHFSYNKKLSFYLILGKPLFLK